VENVGLYDTDFYAWTISHLSQRPMLSSSSAMFSMSSRAKSPARSSHACSIGSRNWSAPIREQRRRITRLIDESPSPRPVVSELLPTSYADALARAADETGLAETAFPTECPFTAAEALAADFLPP
jgi:Domain of unknown function DUF29